MDIIYGYYIFHDVRRTQKSNKLSWVPRTTPGWTGEHLLAGKNLHHKQQGIESRALAELCMPLEGKPILAWKLNCKFLSHRLLSESLNPV